MGGCPPGSAWLGRRWRWWSPPRPPAWPAAPSSLSWETSGRPMRGRRLPDPRRARPAVRAGVLAVAVLAVGGAAPASPRPCGPRRRSGPPARDRARVARLPTAAGDRGARPRRHPARRHRDGDRPPPGEPVPRRGRAWHVRPQRGRRGPRRSVPHPVARAGGNAPPGRRTLVAPAPVAARCSPPAVRPASSLAPTGGGRARGSARLRGGAAALLTGLLGPRPTPATSTRERGQPTRDTPSEQEGHPPERRCTRR